MPHLLNFSVACLFIYLFIYLVIYLFIYLLFLLILFPFFICSYGINKTFLLSRRKMWREFHRCFNGENSLFYYHCNGHEIIPYCEYFGFILINECTLGKLNLER